MADVALISLLKREVDINSLICKWAGVDFPGADVIEKALRKAEETWDGLAVYDRFIPGGLDLPSIYDAFYNFNEFCEGKRNIPGFKLYYKVKKDEWWRNDQDVQRLPTEMGIIRLDFREAMRSTNMTGAPFNLSLIDQKKWAEHDDLTSVEETSLLQLRSGLEFRRHLWGYGSVRCRNIYGSDNSLRVSFDAVHGIVVVSFNNNAECSIGALRRQFLALGS